jgi:hypothetical protein
VTRLYDDLAVEVARTCFAAVLEIDRRTEHHLVALLDALADFDLRS